MTSDNPFNVDTIADLLPPISLISDEDIFMETADLVVDHCPDYFWHAPAASTYKHHNPFCCGKHGLWIHSLMVATAYERLAPSYLNQGLISIEEIDYGRAAVLLHDMRKHGESYTEGESADRDHDIQAAQLIREESELPENVAAAVESHMGAWYRGPEPETPLQQLVHTADMAASSKNGTWGIYKKPEPISEYYPALPEADL